MIPAAKALVDGYRENSWLILRHADSLSDEEALLQPAFEAITFNWVLGHIVEHRDRALVALAQPPLWPEAVAALYAIEPGGVAGAAARHSVKQLLVDLEEVERRLTAALEAATEPWLAERVPTHFGNDQPRGDYVSGLHWHETYHVGQLGLLRSLALAQRKRHS